MCATFTSSDTPSISPCAKFYFVPGRSTVRLPAALNLESASIIPKSSGSDSSS